MGSEGGSLLRQARKTAMAEVVGLMGRSTNNITSSKDAFLEELQSLRVDISAKADKSNSVLNSLIQTITEEARANIALVTQVNKRSETLKSLFNDIERLCKESSQLVNREHVTKLSRLDEDFSSDDDKKPDTSIDSLLEYYDSLVGQTYRIGYKFITL